MLWQVLGRNVPGLNFLRKEHNRQMLVGMLTCSQFINRHELSQMLQISCVNLTGIWSQALDDTNDELTQATMEHSQQSFLPATLRHGQARASQH